MLPEMVTPSGTLILVAGLSYLLGSIPFGLLLTRLMGLGNLREIGSGNIGATNVLRTGNKKAALATLILDGAKGAVAVLVARAFLAEDAAQIAGLFAFLGHLFPVWLGFRGGKGVATFLGVILALTWPAGLATCATWALIAALTRYSSLSALVAAVLSPVWVMALGHPQAAALMIALAAMIVVKHHQNIARLFAGTETKIGQKG